MTSSDRKKQLLQDYKRQAKRMGAYCIRNLKRQKCFVGVSRDIDARMNRHRFELKSGLERQYPALQTDWDLDGSDSFEFEVLGEFKPSDKADYDPTEDLAVLEQMWLEQLQPYEPNGYNKPPR
jgi:hypothetical protein